MQDQEESKNQEIQEKQKQEDNGAMTKTARCIQPCT